jgi:thioredoxin 1
MNESAEFLVVCLCAAWCGTCREYQPGFAALAAQFPQARFVWVDIEDDADWAGDHDIENFPTVLIQRDASVLFYGTLLPHLSHLQRLLASLAAMSAEEAAIYASGTAERRAWQALDFRPALTARPPRR